MKRWKEYFLIWYLMSIDKRGFTIVSIEENYKIIVTDDSDIFLRK